jgi:hypothetical protein
MPRVEILLSGLGESPINARPMYAEAPRDFDLANASGDLPHTRDNIFLLTL